MSRWSGFIMTGVIVLLAAIFLKISKKALTVICTVALIAWLVVYVLPALNL